MNCGTRLNWPAQQQTQSQSTFQHPYGYQQQGNYQNAPPFQQQYGYPGEMQYKKSTSPLLVMFVTVVVLAVLGGAFYLAYNSFLKEPQPAAPPPATQNPSPVNDQPPVDTTPPLISDIKVSQTENSMVITWTTDEPATDRIEYGESVDYSFTTAVDNELSTSHTVTIERLEPETLYHYRVKSWDSAGNEAVSEDNTVTTLQPALKREAQIVTHNLEWDAGGSIISGVVKNTGDVDIEARDIKILIEYESYIAEDQTFEKKGSVNSDPAIIEPGKSTDFSISLEVINVKPDYKISLILLPE